MQRSAAIAVAGLLVLSLTAPGAVVAQESDSPIDDLFGDDESEDGGLLSSPSDAVGVIWGFARGLGSRIKRSVGDAAGIGDEPPGAAEAADDLQAVANEHSGALQAYANERMNAGTDWDVFRLEFRVDGETATKFVTADLENGSYADGSVVDATSRTVDHTCTLEDDAARNAADELETFVADYVEPGKNVSRSLVSEIGAEYGGQVDCSFWGG